MKKIFLLLGLSVLLSSSAFADIQISLAAGYLRTSTGGSLLTATTAAPSGGALLLLVAANSTNNTFTNALSPGQYVAGGDVQLGAFSFNKAGGVSGTGQTTTNSITFDPVALSVNTGRLIELRWFPDITLDQYNHGTTPVNGTTYGVYNPSLYPAVNGMNLSTDGGSAWSVPSNPSTAYALNFFTKDNAQIAGTQNITEGYASMVVSVPEPSTGVLIGLSLITVVGAVRKWRNIRTF